MLDDEKNCTLDIRDLNNRLEVYQTIEMVLNYFRIRALEEIKTNDLSGIDKIKIQSIVDNCNAFILQLLYSDYHENYQDMPLLSLIQFQTSHVDCVEKSSKVLKTWKKLKGMSDKCVLLHLIKYMKKNFGDFYSSAKKYCEKSDLLNGTERCKAKDAAQSDAIKNVQEDEIDMNIVKEVEIGGKFTISIQHFQASIVRALANEFGNDAGNNSFSSIINRFEAINIPEDNDCQQIVKLLCINRGKFQTQHIKQFFHSIALLPEQEKCLRLEESSVTSLNVPYRPGSALMWQFTTSSDKVDSINANETHLSNLSSSKSSIDFEINIGQTEMGKNPSSRNFIIVLCSI
ncbi:MAG: hypothetical protein MHMPM18_001695 [Marteilia pararefringens]